MMQRLPKYVAIVAGAISILTLFCFFFLVSFEIFETPDIKVLSQKCDHEGLRHALIKRVEGNAVTNASLQVFVRQGCNVNERSDKGTSIFVIDGNVDDDDIKIAWVTFDTLSIEYAARLRVIRQLDKVEYNDSTLNVYVRYSAK